MAIDESFIDRVREAVDIAEVVGGYVALKQRRPGDFWGRCPFHEEKTSSFHVVSDRGMFKCFGCGRGGNAFTFLMEMEGLSFMEAVKSLAERAGIELPGSAFSPEAERARTDRDRIFNANQVAMTFFHKYLLGNSPESSKAMEYLEERGINQDIIDRYKIGWAPSGWEGLLNAAVKKKVETASLGQAGLVGRKKDGSGFYDRFRARVMFPILNLSGKPVAFGGRRIDGITPERDDAKYINSNETAVYRKGDNLYGLFTARDAIRKSRIAYLVEGYTDLLALVQADVPNVVASLGTALTEAQAKLIARFAQRVVIVYDSDRAGIDAAIRAANVLTVAGLETRIVELPTGADPDSLLRDRGAEALREILTDHESFIRFHLRSSGMSDRMTQTQRIDVARDVLDTVAQIDNPLRREALLGELAAALDMRRESLDRALAQARPRSSQGSTPVQKITLEIAPQSTSEKDLVHALLARPELINECIERITPDHFRDRNMRVIYSELERAQLRNEPVDTTNFPNRFNDPGVRAFIAEAILDGEQTTFEDVLADVIECVAKILIRDIRDRRKEIELEMTKARKEGKPVRDLWIENNKLIVAERDLANL